MVWRDGYGGCLWKRFAKKIPSVFVDSHHDTNPLGDREHDALDSLLYFAILLECHRFVPYSIRRQLYRLHGRKARFGSLHYSLDCVSTYHFFRVRGNIEGSVSFRPYFVIQTILGLVIAYIMIMIRLLHEGVDHAL